MTGIEPSKNNFWPRPKDQARDMLLRTVIEFRGEAVIVDMADDGQGNLDITTVNATTGNGALYQWDEVNDNLVNIPFPFVPTTPTQITGIVLFQGSVYVATGGSATNTDNGRVYRLNPDGTYANVSPTWSGSGAVMRENYSMFVFGNELFIAGVANTAPPTRQLEMHRYNGTAWAAPEVILVAAVGATLTATVSRRVASLNGDMWFGVFQEQRLVPPPAPPLSEYAFVQARTAPGVFTPELYRFPTPGPIYAVNTMNGNEVWAGQQVGGSAGSTPTIPVLAKVAPNTASRIALPGIYDMLTVPSGRDFKNGSGNNQLILHGGPIFDVVSGPFNGVSVLDDNSEYSAVRTYEDLPTAVALYRQRSYVALSSSLAASAGDPNATSYVAVLE